MLLRHSERREEPAFGDGNNNWLFTATGRGRGPKYIGRLVRSRAGPSLRSG